MRKHLGTRARLWAMLAVMVMLMVGGRTVQASYEDCKTNAVKLNRYYYVNDLKKNSIYGYLLELDIPQDGRIRIRVEDCTKDVFRDLDIQDSQGASDELRTSIGWFEGEQTLSSGWITVKKGKYYPAYSRSGKANGEARLIVEYQRAEEYQGELEDNDTWETATVLASGVVCEGNYSKYNDTDLYKFVLESPGLAVINVVSSSGSCGYTVYAAEGEQGARKLFSADGLIRQRLSAGTYYVERVPEQYGYGKNYSVRVDITSEKASSAELESNDTSSLANVKGKNKWYAGNLNSADDVDWFKVKVTSKCYITLEAKVPRQTDGGLVRIALCKSNLKEIGSAENTTDSYFAVGKTTVSPGTYYIKITGGRKGFLEGKDYSFRLKQDALQVKLNKTSLKLEGGAKAKLELSGAQKTVTWKSSKPSVATVSSDGTVKAKKLGETKVTATYGGKKYTCTVTVYSKFAAGYWYANEKKNTYVRIYKVQGRSLWFSAKMPYLSCSKTKAVISADGKSAAAKVRCGKNQTHTLTFVISGSNIIAKEATSCTAKYFSTKEKDSRSKVSCTFYPVAYFSVN